MLGVKTIAHMGAGSQNRGGGGGGGGGVCRPKTKRRDEPVLRQRPAKGICP